MPVRCYHPYCLRQDEELARLEGKSISHRKLAILVPAELPFRADNAQPVEIQQDAAKFYPSLIEDTKSAQHSIHLQYFIWAVDPFTDGLRQILIEKARAGVEVRLLYDPIGSQAHVGRRYVRDMFAAGIRNGTDYHRPTNCIQSATAIIGRSPSSTAALLIPAV
jgi:cardiolipin synthase